MKKDYTLKDYGCTMPANAWVQRKLNKNFNVNHNKEFIHRTVILPLNNNNKPKEV